MSNVYMLIAGTRLELQMSGGIALIPSLMLIVAMNHLPKKKLISYFCACFSILLVFGNSLQVWIDQEAMYEGREACKTMMHQLITDLKNQDLLKNHYEYYFVGVPAKNKQFYVSRAFYLANGYAQVGNFWVSGSTNQMSYHGLINKVMGFHLPMSFKQYGDVRQLYNISSIPSFPTNGYIQRVGDNLIIIKFSEYETYKVMSE